MCRNITISFSFFLILILGSCNNNHPKQIDDKHKIPSKNINLLTDYPPINTDGDVNAVIEIPAGTTDKWELNKSNGKIEWEHVNGIPRKINYLGYPANYGMIPKTLLSKKLGGDGDPLDIIVIGPQEEKGNVVKCKLLGVLYLVDRGEQDDKLIAVSEKSPLYSIDNLNELNNQYQGITQILKLWFINYKGPNKLTSTGYGDKSAALEILNSSIQEFNQK